MTITATGSRFSARPLIPYEIVDGKPVNPVDPNLPPGVGDLGRPGEIVAVDAAVTAVTTDGQRWLLLIKRRKPPGGWALPGGKLHDGEHPLDGVVRELAEEAGLRLPGAQWWLSEPQYVRDPRNRRNAWIVSLVAHVELGLVLWLPHVEGGSDAEQATWVRSASPTQVRDDLADRYGGRLYEAHEDMVDAVVA